MEVAIVTSLDPLELRVCCKYWLIGAWLEFESPSIDLFDFEALRLEGLGSTTSGALVLMIVCGPTSSSNVISPLSLITISKGLTSGFICMFEMLFSVCCVFNFGMMI
jgi:hypothetical protein